MAEQFGVHWDNGRTTTYWTRKQAAAVARCWDGGHLVRKVGDRWVDVEEGETDG